MTIKTHWDAVNPWRDSVVYVTLEELAQAVAGGSISTPRGTVPYTVEYVLENWKVMGEKLDAYILPQPNGRHSIGVRYGKEGSEYLSPYNANPAITTALLAKYWTDAVA